MSDLKERAQRAVERALEFQNLKKGGLDSITTLENERASILQAIKALENEKKDLLSKPYRFQDNDKELIFILEEVFVAEYYTEDRILGKIVNPKYENKNVLRVDNRDREMEVRELMKREDERLEQIRIEIKTKSKLNQDLYEQIEAARKTVNEFLRDEAKLNDLDLDDKERTFVHAIGRTFDARFEKIEDALDDIKSLLKDSKTRDEDVVDRMRKLRGQLESVLDGIRIIRNKD